MVVFRKMCCITVAYRYTCTYNILYSLSYVKNSVMVGCEFLLNSSPVTYFHHNSKILTVGPDH